MARLPIHPDEILVEELAFLNMSPSALARELAMPADQLAAILSGEQGVNDDVALRLSCWLGTSPELWLSLQPHYKQRAAEAEPVV